MALQLKPLQPFAAEASGIDLRQPLTPQQVKEIEHAEFMKVISPWEREHLLLHV